MASLLYRLGRWCAHRPWLTMGAWVAVIAIVAGSAATFSKPLTSEFSIPGSRFETVLEQLKTDIPQAAGASGTVAFSSDDGFDERERSAVEATLADWRALAGVSDVAGPFATQEQLDSAAQQLADAREQTQAGRQETDRARDQLEEGQAELDASQTELDAGQAQLDAARGQLSPEQISAAEQQIQQGQQQIDADQAELDVGIEQLVAGEQELAQAREQLQVGERLAALSAGLRFVSQDGTVALAQVQFEADSKSLDPELTAQLPGIGEQLAGSGVQVDYSAEIVQDLSNILGPGEIVGLVVAAVVLLVMFGSLLAAGLPLVMALVGVGAALTLTSVVQMNDTAPTLALMLGLAVGIDYSLFLANRHRTQLRAGMPIRESIALATGTSGNAVTFAGLTVIIALTALVVTDIPFLTVMGLVAAGTVAVAVLVALTLTPAVLALMGHRILPRARNLRDQDAAPVGPKHRDTSRSGWAPTVVRHPWATIVGVLALVGLLAYPVGDLRLGLPDGSAEPTDSTAYQTYDQIRDAFGAGVNGPIIAVAELDEPLPEGDAARSSKQADIGEALFDLPDVEYVLPFGVSQDQRTLAFQVVPAGGPTQASTVELVQTLDDLAATIGDDHEATLGLTGQTVANIDISQQLADALPLYLALVIGLSLLLLLLVFRSLVIPVLATAGFPLSVGAAFGSVVAVYQWGNLSWLFGVNEPGPILSFLPTLLIGVLFGLAMDYQLFLVSAMRESHAHTGSRPARPSCRASTTAPGWSSPQRSSWSRSSAASSSPSWP